MDNVLMRLFTDLMRAKASDDVDCMPDEPGYDDFIKASDAEFKEKNYKKAAELYEKACTAGHPMAQVNYALWFLEGKRPGFAKDLTRAFHLFEEAAKKNVGMAQYNLANFYYTGRGGVVKENHGKAYLLCKEAIKDPRVNQMRQGDPYMLLSSMYLKGEGCTMNHMKAKKMMEKASQFGHPAASPGAVRMMDMLSQCSGVDTQRETDNRWDRMVAYGEAHPEEDPVTIRDHVARLNKFGFNVDCKLTEKQLDMKGKFDKFMEVTGGALSLMDNYEMEDTPVPLKKCGRCGKEASKRACSKCGEHYCSRDCQKKDWQSHKKVCQAIQAERQV